MFGGSVSVKPGRNAENRMCGFIRDLLLRKSITGIALAARVLRAAKSPRHRPA
jgi:hypothetical protein